MTFVNPDTSSAMEMTVVVLLAIASVVVKVRWTELPFLKYSHRYAFPLFTSSVNIILAVRHVDAA